MNSTVSTQQSGFYKCLQSTSQAPGNEVYGVSNKFPIIHEDSANNVMTIPYKCDFVNMSTEENVKQIDARVSNIERVLERLENFVVEITQITRNLRKNN